MVAAWGEGLAAFYLSFDSFKLVKPAARSNVNLIIKLETKPDKPDLEQLLNLLLLSTSSPGQDSSVWQPNT